MAVISVIIPVYNGEKYLSESIESVLKQSYKDTELILINDGSIDNSLEICQRFQKKDKRIKVITQSNQGLSSARNTGIDNSNGEYLFFLDADDILEEDTLELMHKSIEKKLDTIVVCNFNKFKKNIVRDEKKYNYGIVNYSKEKYFEEIFLLEKNTYAWGELIPKKMMLGIKFPLGKYFEDMATMYKIILQAKEIIYIEKPLLWYRQHDGSIVSSISEKKSKDYIEAVDTMCKYVSEKIPALKEKSKVIQCYCKIAVIERENQFQDKSFIVEQKKFVKNNVSFAKKQARNLMQKIKFYLYEISPKIYFKFNKINKLYNKKY